VPGLRRAKEGPLGFVRKTENGIAWTLKQKCLR
jgi:hypothetical protein